MSILKNSRRLVAVCYLLALVGWLLFGTAQGVRMLWARSRGEYPQYTLTANDLSRRSFENYADLEWDEPPYDDPDLYLSTDNDPQLVWQGSGYLETVVLHAAHYTPPGAVALYYLKPGQTDFSEAQKVYGAVTGSGEYTFRLGGVQVSGLRIDPDSRGGIPTLFKGVELNPPRFWLACLCPSLGQALLLLALPAAAAAAVRLLSEVYLLGGKHV